MYDGDDKYFWKLEPAKITFTAIQRHNSSFEKLSCSKSTQFKEVREVEVERT